MVLFHPSAKTLDHIFSKILINCLFLRNSCSRTELKQMILQWLLTEDVLHLSFWSAVVPACFCRKCCSCNYFVIILFTSGITTMMCLSLRPAKSSMKSVDFVEWEGRGNWNLNFFIYINVLKPSFLAITTGCFLWRSKAQLHHNLPFWGKFYKLVVNWFIHPVDIVAVSQPVNQRIISEEAYIIDIRLFKTQPDKLCTQRLQPWTDNN